MSSDPNDIINALVGGNDLGQPQEKTEEFYKSIREMYTKKNLHFITDLSLKQISSITKIICLFEWSDKKLPIFKRIIDNFMTLSVSKARKSRGEFFETFKGQYPMEAQRNNFMNRYFQPQK